MRLISLCLISILLVASGQAQTSSAGEAPRSPVGSLFSESFGDSGSPCGYGVPWNTGLYSYTGCDTAWGKVVLGSGGSAAIGASPGSKAYPYGAHSLLLTTGTTNTYVVNSGFIPAIPATTVLDIEIGLNLTSITINPGDNNPFFYIGNDVNGASSWQTLINFQADSTNVAKIIAQGSTQSAKSAALTTGVDNVIKVHLAPGAASSTIQVNGGAVNTFTENSNISKHIIFGDSLGSTKNATYAISYLKISSPTMVGFGNGPTVWINPTDAAQTNGTALSAANLTSGASAVKGGNGTLTCSNSGASALQYNSAAALSGVSSIDAFGVYYPASSSSGVEFPFASSPASQQCSYTFLTFSPKASLAYWFYDSPGSTIQRYAINQITGGDVMVANFGNHKLFLESGSATGSLNSFGAPYTYSASTSYFISYQFQQYATWAVGGTFLQQTSGGNSCTIGETMTQATSNATGTLVDKSLYGILVRAASGTADASHAWTGGTSSCTATPSSVISSAAATMSANDGDTITQATSGATATVLHTMLPGTPISYFQIYNITGSPDGTHVWSDATTSTSMTPTATPAQYGMRTYHTMQLFDSSCSLLTTLRTIANTVGTVPTSFNISQTDASTNEATNFYMDKFRVDYVWGNLFPCK